ncbi:putative phosphoserine phosphatase/1-acylglycerol-3-phosphate O-acyltransferase [Nocardia transvalensis]|uniref:1-acyl-sn-glycerol-3-phosphate acyltransferase n=1 Tax=Nocardia transvalensis TaxID=37333 RepID=A0A7W9PBK0_9NOCA|nr:HAD-IB family hydrolase [Nocardia transvalensis]MBB5913106.1 putative phosphoserine phosphatase/1-acylglycerol-3-phosphate O-acyltransferase [Nocardia transvalensis]
MTDMSVDAAVAAIAAGPQGPRVAAVFDFGGTVVHGFTPPSALRRLTRRGDALAGSLVTSIRGARAEGEYERFLQRVMHLWAGHTESELAELGERLFHRTIYGHLYPEAWRLIRAHEAAGHTLVLASCLTRFQVLPAAAELGIEHALCTSMAAQDGVLTGYVEDKPLWRNGKADRVRRFAVTHDVELAESYAYADAATDLPLLELVGRPRAVNPDPRMALEAGEREWPVLGFRPREGARIPDIARTAAGFVSLIGGALAGVALESPTRERQRMADAMISYAADATLRATGVRVRVTGAEHARTARPAVFLFNHQSQFDMVVLAEVLRSGFTGIVKQEVTKNPVFGPLMRFAGATFIDRSDTAGTRAALVPVVETLRGGLSIVVAPEGTRSLTPRVGPFKKGAFHIAMQAGVPIVPLVIRNAGEIAWRDSAIVHKGTVDVAVLPPIDVGGWNPHDMDAEVERVRQLFIDTLLNWPAPEGAPSRQG